MTKTILSDTQPAETILTGATPSEIQYAENTPAPQTTVRKADLIDRRKFLAATGGLLLAFTVDGTNRAARADETILSLNPSTLPLGVPIGPSPTPRSACHQYQRMDTHRL